MSDKDMKHNFADKMKQLEKMLKVKQQNVTDKKRKSLEEDEDEEPLNRKRHCGGDSCSDSNGSTSSLHSAEDSSSSDSESTSSSEQDTPMLDVNREAECLVRQDKRVNPGLSGRCEPVADAGVAGNSAAGPRTKAKQKIWYREATSTTSCSPEEDAAMEDE